MKKTLFLFIIIAANTCLSQNGPISFETGGYGTLWTWTVFENDNQPPLEIVANPSVAGINLSAQVAKFTAKQNGMPWAGCESQHGADIGTFTLTASNCIVKIMVYKPIISPVGIKFATPSGASTGELLVSNTLINQWEELTFDFTGIIGAPSSSGIDQIIIFPDFQQRNQDNICYFDNIKFSNQGPPLNEPMVAAPTPTYNASNVISMFSNPYTNVTVDTWQAPWSQGTLNNLQIAGNDTKKYTNLNYVGIETLGSNILNVSAMTHLRIDAWTANITNLKIKLVDFGADMAYAGGDDSEHELSFVPTLEQWNTYDIPLSNFTSLNSTQHIAQLIISAAPAASGVVYIDNVLFRNDNNIGLGENNKIEMEVFPNPTRDELIIRHSEQTTRILLVDCFGQRLMEIIPTSSETTIDLSNFPAGYYLLQSEQSEQKMTKRIVKL
ncbi:MAG: T9SS type A sorting domain-containing protein [Crocinitomicaceae bacterium]|nr:T9SS type A sorting domain-containing protein [Crocinitomicaceae bacterium]